MCAGLFGPGGQLCATSTAHSNGRSLESIRTHVCSSNFLELLVPSLSESAGYFPVYVAERNKRTVFSPQPWLPYASLQMGFY